MRPGGTFAFTGARIERATYMFAVRHLEYGAIE
jgi:hypothetical protein